MPGQILTLLDQNQREPWAIDEGASMNIRGALVDDAGAAIAESSVLTLKVNLHADGSAINGRDDQSIKDENNGVLNTDGTFILRLGPSDSVIVDPALAANRTERHNARFVWTWNDGAATRTGILEVRFGVRKTQAVA